MADEQSASLTGRFNDKIITLQMRDETITVQLQRRDSGYIEAEGNVIYEGRLGPQFSDAVHIQLQPEYVAIVSGNNPDSPKTMVQRLEDVEKTLHYMRDGNTGGMTPEIQLHLDIKAALVEANDALVKSGEVNPSEPLIKTLEAGPWV